MMAPVKSSRSDSLHLAHVTAVPSGPIAAFNSAKQARLRSELVFQDPSSSPARHEEAVRNRSWGRSFSPAAGAFTAFASR
jgi:hypothetical protein